MERNLRARFARRIGLTLATVALLTATICLSGVASAGCRTSNPNLVTVQGQRSGTAVDVLTALDALSATAINLNKATGKEHLSIKDTALVRDFTLAAGQAMSTYASAGSTALSTVTSGLARLSAQLSAEGSSNPTLKTALAAVAAAVGALRSA